MRPYWIRKLDTSDVFICVSVLADPSKYVCVSIVINLICYLFSRYDLCIFLMLVLVMMFGNDSEV